MPCIPSSRPKPDCLKPPNGVETRTELFELTDSTPVSSARATRSARAAVARPDRAREPVRRVVREPHRVLLVLERDDGRHRPEHLLPRDPIVVRGLDERARVPVARSVRRPTREQRLAVDEGRHRLAVRGRDERPHLGRIVQRIADADAAGGLDEVVQKSVVDRLLDQDARARAAVLAGVVEHGVRRRRGGPLQIGVGEDHVRGLAAELERDALDRRRRALHHLPADLRRAREADLGHVRVLDEPRADDRALADEHVDDAFGDTRLQHELREPERRQRRQLRRLQHDRVAARERRAELPRGDVEREVPRHDQADHAERLAEGHVDAARDRDRLAVVLVDCAGVEVEDLRDHPHLAARARDRLADVARLDPRPAPPRAPRRASRRAGGGGPGPPVRRPARPGTRRLRGRPRRRSPPPRPARARRSAPRWRGSSRSAWRYLTMTYDRAGGARGDRKTSLAGVESAGRGPRRRDHEPQLQDLGRRGDVRAADRRQGHDAARHRPQSRARGVERRREPRRRARGRPLRRARGLPRHAVRVRHAGAGRGAQAARAAAGLRADAAPRPRRAADRGTVRLVPRRRELLRDRDRPRGRRTHRVRGGEARRERGRARPRPAAARDVPQRPPEREPDRDRRTAS